MRARQAVVCPKCGAFNRPTWEYCPRCSESLAGAQLAEGVVPEAGVEEGPGAPSSAATTLVSVGLVLALAVAAVAAWRYAARIPEPARPDSRMFTIGTQPPAQPAPPPLSGPGVVDYDAGRRLMNAGDFAGAAARLAAAAGADPANAGYRHAYALALWRGGDRQGALVQHAEAARLDPGLALQYARSLDAAGRGADAAGQYEAILAQNPGAVAVEEDLGRLLFRSAEYTRAVPHLQAAVLARPDDPVLQQELAYSLDQAGDRRQAEAAYRQVIGSTPQAVLSRGLLAENLVEQGRKDEALAVLHAGARAHSRHAPAPAAARQRPRANRPAGRGRGGLPDLRPSGPERARCRGDHESSRPPGDRGEEAMRSLQVLAGVALLALALPGSGLAQGLGDSAARERAKRAQAGKKAEPRVYTEGDLAAGRPPADKGEGGSSAPSSSPMAAAVAEEESPSSPPEPLPSELLRPYLDALTNAKTRQAEIEGQVRVLSAKLNPMSGTFIYGSQGSNSANEEAQVRAQLNQLEGALTQARREVSEASEAADRASRGQRPPDTGQY